MFAEGFLWFFLAQFGQGALIIASIFWIWVLVDCLIKEPSEGNDKVAWLLFILLVPIIGAGLYYFIRRPERVKVAGR